jgi:hypothetical protein
VRRKEAVIHLPNQAKVGPQQPRFGPIICNQRKPVANVYLSSTSGSHEQAFKNQLKIGVTGAFVKNQSFEFKKIQNLRNFENQ